MSRFAFLDPRPTLDLSVIVPVLNEISHIDACLDSITLQELVGVSHEILVVDGGSTDGTREAVAQRCSQSPRFRLIENPNRRVSFALNAGMRASRGRLLARMDAHALYDADYLRASVAELERTGASAVGGVQVPIPGAPTRQARAIAAVQQSRLGMGGATHRRVDYEGPAESLPYGVFHRETVAEVGGFDEDLFRTEDNDFFQRIRAAGGLLWLSFRIRARYVCRPTLTELFRQYFTTGAEIVPTLLRNRHALSPRHLAPGLAAVAGLALVLAAAFGPAPVAGAALAAVAVAASAYGVALLVSSAGLGARHGLGLLPWILATFVVLHVSYAVGTLVGALRTPSRVRRRRSREDSLGFS